MDKQEKWIWIPSEKDGAGVPECATLPDGSNKGYEVVAFSRNYNFEKSIKSISLRFSGDTFFKLYLNGRFVSAGPAAVGGDFLTDWISKSSYYATELKIDAVDADMIKGQCNFFALVRKAPTYLNEYSKGIGGFYLQAEIEFNDGSKVNVSTDESWIGKRVKGYTRPYIYEDTVGDGELLHAIVIENRWNTKTAPIPPCQQFELPLENDGKIVVSGTEKTTVTFDFDKVYAGYSQLASTKPVRIVLKYFETDDFIAAGEVKLTKDLHYIGLDLFSVGKVELDIYNLEEGVNEIRYSFVPSHYPVTQQAQTITSDMDLNKVLEVCAHSLKYCRQSMHLDSPKHCEPLACTGDYYVDTLMTAFTFGDMRLSAFDLLRTAEVLEHQDGRMFHTTYSLIWVQMLWDTYLFTGDKALLIDCTQALNLLLNRFSRYIGDTGLIETPPDYMFVDWLVADGYSIHHPPKALGQTCLNMFYFGALQTASKIYNKINMPEKALACDQKAATLKACIIDLLWDAERGLFFEGLNTPTPEHLLGDFMPQNSTKRYYRKHANILAAYFGIFDKEENQKLLEKVVQDDTLGEVQPYFMHFYLDAIYRNGLRDKYTLSLVEQWKKPIAECPKGLPEGFYPPEEGYHFDHSHAWGGTPAYAVPLALTGFTMLKEGFKEIEFNPSLCGLRYANVEIPTPYGMISVCLSEKDVPKITVPNEIKWLLK